MLKVGPELCLGTGISKAASTHRHIFIFFHSHLTQIGIYLHAFWGCIKTCSVNTSIESWSWHEMEIHTMCFDFEWFICLNASFSETTDYFLIVYAFSTPFLWLSGWRVCNIIKNIPFLINSSHSSLVIWVKTVILVLFKLLSLISSGKS